MAKKNYLGYIKRRIAKGKWNTSLNLYPNQIKKLRELGFIVTENRRKNKTSDNEKIWCKVNCKNAEEGTYAYKLFKKAKDKKNMHLRKAEKHKLLSEDCELYEEEECVSDSDNCD